MAEQYGQEQDALKQAREIQRALREAQETVRQVREVKKSFKEIGDVLEPVRQAQDAVRQVREMQKPLREVRDAMRQAKEVKNFLKETRGTLEEVRKVRDSIEAVRVGYLGRSAQLTNVKKEIGYLPIEQRKEVGREANRTSQELEKAINEQTNQVVAIEREVRLQEEAVDITLPGVPYPQGSLHPTHRVIDDVVDFFVGLGYRVAEGPEVETDYYNFTALNIPPGHPARSEHDTFFVDEGLVLRTHTSPVQVRTMLSQEPPIYVVVPGKTFRRDSDPTHTPMFHQIEGLAVDKGITLAHLKGTLAALARYVFGEEVGVRLRPGFFPFTEPSVELDVSCFVCGGEDPRCKVCKGSGWLEMLGAGMVDPAVLEEVGYDPEEYTGFAFGMGPDRMAMVKYGIPDLRMFFEGDLRFLNQF